MKAPLLTVLAVSLAITGCARVSESRLNPFNWFGSSREEVVTLAPEGGYVVPQTDYRLPAVQITALSLQPVSGGAILVATGIAPTQGWWDAELVSTTGHDDPVDGKLTYRLLMAEPTRGTPDATRTGSSATREITVSKFLSNQKVALLRKLVVEGQSNARSVSR